MGTTSRISKWIPIALCCVPAVAIAAIVGLGILIGGASFGASFGGPLGLSLIVLALLVCPLHMGWMMWRIQKQQGTSGNSAAPAGCCLPKQRVVSVETDPAVRLQELRTQREMLERQVTKLQMMGRMPEMMGSSMEPMDSSMSISDISNPGP